MLAAAKPLADATLTQDDLKYVAQVIYEQAGIVIREHKEAMARGRLQRRVKALGLNSISEYCAFLKRPEASGEISELINALTTNHTSFFRERHHFDHLRGHALPHLLNAGRRSRIRIWSSACSSGEEPYSIALSMLEVLPEAARLDVKILASDIDPNMVKRAEAAVYGEEAVSPIPVELRKRWMEPVRDGASMAWRPNAEVREMVTCRELNLMGPWPMKGRFDAIFCRNVAIYFDEPTQERLWGRYPACLEKGGRLYIGHSERTSDPRFVTDGLTTYRLKEGAGA